MGSSVDNLGGHIFFLTKMYLAWPHAPLNSLTFWWHSLVDCINYVRDGYYSIFWVIVEF
jgi:hypothetical protein